MSAISPSDFVNSALLGVSNLYWLAIKTKLSVKLIRCQIDNDMFH